jgi:hypothetical protein
MARQFHKAPSIPSGAQICPDRGASEARTCYANVRCSWRGSICPPEDKTPLISRFYTTLLTAAIRSSILWRNFRGTVWRVLVAEAMLSGDPPLPGFLPRFLVAIPSCWLRPSGSRLFLLQRFSNCARPVTPDRDVFTLRVRGFRFII